MQKKTFSAPFRSISRVFGSKCSLKRATNSLKMGAGCVFEHPKWSRVIFEKTWFRPFLTPFQSHNGPFLEDSILAFFEAISNPFWGHLGPFCGCFGVRLNHLWGEKAKHHQKATRTLPKWIPPQDMATRPRWCMSWGHRAPFGAV